MKRIAITILIDALGWEVQARRPFLAEYGDRKRLRTVAGFSSAAIPSLLTGRRPSEHGRWFLYRRNPAESPFGFARLVAPFAGPGRLGRKVRRAFERCFAYFREITGYHDLYAIPLRHLPAFDLPARRPVFGPRGAGETPTLFDRLTGRGIPFRVWYWNTPEERSFAELGTVLRDGDVPYLFLYAAGLDGVMHRTGTGSDATRGLLDRYEERIRALVEEAKGRGVDVDLCVCSDHGMVDVVRVIDLMRPVRALPFREGRDYLPFYDSTFARFWFTSDRAREAIVDLLAGAGGGRLLDVDEQEELGIRFPGEEYGEQIFLADPGTVIAPSFMGERPPAAMHGYHPDHRGSDGLLIRSAPIPEGTDSILDLASLLEGAAASAHGGGDGSRDGASS